MNKTKKIILFIVEGINDETSLSLILSKLVSDTSVQFHVIKVTKISGKLPTIQTYVSVIFIGSCKDN